MLAASAAAALSFAPAGVRVAPTAARASAPVMEGAIDQWAGFEPDFTKSKPWTSSEISNKAGLAALAKELNPIVGFWDPLGIADRSKETIGWFRHAEIKHGRVAMAAFVGYTIQAAGVHFPWDLQTGSGAFEQIVPAGTSTISFGDISAAGGPLDQWDALPSPAKIQILMAVGFLEVWGEASTAMEANGQQHYVRGGKPGYYPPFRGNMPHPVPFNLWDPFGVTSKMTAEMKAKKLQTEINNGRLAMIGIMGYISAAKGLFVPGLDSLPIPKYAGEVMAPFSSTNADLPFVADMLAARAAQVANEANLLGAMYHASQDIVAAPVVAAVAEAAP